MQKVTEEERLLMKKLLGLSVVVVISLTGCAGVWAGKPPACPPPSHAAVNELSAVNRAAVAYNLVEWIGEIERYCSGIDAMRED